MEQFGVLSLVPAIVVLLLAVLTRRPLESLVVGSLVGLCMIDFTNLLTGFAALAQKTILNETIGWVVLVCSLMGSLIVLMLRTGAALAFSIAVSGKAKSRRSALLSTWVLGLLIFIDDYLNMSTDNDLIITSDKTLKRFCFASCSTGSTKIIVVIDFPIAEKAVLT